MLARVPRWTSDRPQAARIAGKRVGAASISAWSTKLAKPSAKIVESLPFIFTSRGEKRYFANLSTRFPMRMYRKFLPRQVHQAPQRA